MKKSIFLLFLVIFYCLLYGQDVQFPAALINAGGAGSNQAQDHISKWRIGYVNVFHINSMNHTKSINLHSNERIEIKTDEWLISAYPNPVTDYLNILINASKQDVFRVNVTGITGQKIIEEIKSIRSGVEVQLDLSKLTPSIYLIHVFSEKNFASQVFKVVKK